MKKALITLLLIPVFAITQTLEELDFIAPFNAGVAAIEKDNSWGFINDKGAIIIAFRDDLVLTETDYGKYPIFHNNRCLISEKKDGILYYGYIDKKGKKVIDTKFLNATNFNNNVALALKIISKTIGTNNILDKPVVINKYFEVTIDTTGSVKDYLNPKGINVVLDKKFLNKPPKITSKLLSDELVAIINENSKWVIKSVK
ncbi:MAG: WG repeat-containing protein [Algibacter sp.]|uniref:WG repeat-containing protein n=1 Tax=Algibacter sp. TaxID=1872428 RepID=UPI002618A3D4|nr:WG repeat-containing protein [Algibacter sp.]MDG1730375.1 WG repeat-containing protein [Algibacter sp.]MDG2178853.1 WG repeat-containing protein [Algibacter sp.]